MANEKDGLTPLMRQYRRTKESLDKDTILFFRLGDFYEMFFEDAQRAAPILGVAITKRAGIPMCGVPYHAIEGYLAKVIKRGLKAAICEQLEDPKLTKGLVRRDITRIITPGTVIEDAILDAGTSNYLAAVFTTKTSKYGVAALELSTGELLVEDCESTTALIETLQRIGARETLVSEEQRDAIEALARPVLGTLTATDSWTFMEDAATDLLKQHFHVHSLEGYCGEGQIAIWVCAAGALLYHVSHKLHCSIDHVRTLHVRHDSAYLLFDECTCRNLDLFPRPGQAESETLLGVLDGTCTPMGKRLLRRWMRSPLRTISDINARQAAVAECMADRRFLADLRAKLGEVRDFERVMTRLGNGSGNGRDLRMLADSLLQVPNLRDRLATATAPLLQQLQAQLKDLPELRETLASALVDTPPMTIKEGGLIREGFSAELDEIRQAAHEGHQWIANYQAQQQEATGIRTLRVRHNSVFGFYIEVSKGQLALVPSSYERRQTVVNAERFITPELKVYEQKIFGAQDRANALEYELFQKLRDEAIAALVDIQTTASAVAALDVLQGFADRALTLDYCRPKVDDTQSLNIQDGRHPIVEIQPNTERFVPNDTRMNGDTHQFVLITGPNMAGKSTYIRQVAILAIMAHMGCYVPAESMHIGVMDRVFTRVGAGDDLARGRSTFMVEMQETANILNNATPRSLIVLDEIGRGTSTFDGISIAWSVVEYLHNTPERKARTLFATHYHELTDLARSLKGVQNYSVQVKEQGDGIVFLRRIIPGAADKSYGIHVARLAGMPAEVLDRANTILNALEGQKAVAPETPRRRKMLPETADLQGDLFEENSDYRD